MIRIIVLLITLFLSATSFSRENIRIVGSTTLYPFVTIAAENFGKIAGKTPIVEATGTGGGFRLLCSGNSLDYPDIVNASRLMRPSEKALCKQNSVKNIQKITLGYDGIILAKSREAKNMDLSLKQIYLSIAKQVPYNGKIIDNPYKTWKSIDPSLPDHKIEIYGPSFTSGTRDAFIEMVMHKFCQNSEEMLNLMPDEKERLSICSNIREDGYYVDMSENYNLIIQKLIQNPKAIGIISFSFMEDNPQIKPVKIAHVYPNVATITSGEYLLSRPLFLYVNLDHQKQLKDLGDFVKYITGPEMLGADGYLSKKGLISY